MQLSKAKFKKQNNKNINNKTKVGVGASLSIEKKASYLIPTMNCYGKNGQLRDPDFVRHKLYHPKQYQYSQDSILWVVLKISTIALRTRLIRVQLQHATKQVGLTIHFKTSSIKYSDNIIYKTQKPCTDLLQTQRLIES